MVLTTKRCVLRPFADADADQLHDLWTSAGVRRFLWDDEVIPIARTRAAIARSQRLLLEGRVGLWGAWPTGSPNLIAFGGLWPFRDPPELELLYGVAEPFWGWRSWAFAWIAGRKSAAWTRSFSKWRDLPASS